ncbi:MAG: DUF6612 family protein [Candidatus Altiarchaeota archaeon]|nr:DUF6612 family protein [Candidatus Altiarchaeota archaeon]
MDKKTLSLLFIGFLLFASGCTQEKVLTNKEIMTKSEQAMTGLESYAFDMMMDMTLSGNITPMLGSTEMTMNMNTTSQIDITNKKSYTKGSMSLMGMDFPIELYTIENIQYSSSPMGGWTKQTMEGVWNNSNMVIRSSIADRIDVVRKEDEILDGVDCYVLYFQPEAEDVLELMGTSQGGMSGMANQENFMESVKNVELWEKISKSDFIVKEMRMVMDVDSEGTEATLDSTFRLYDLDKEFTIVLPKEAEEATQIPTARI